MVSLIKELGIDRLGVAERLALMHELWDSIAAEPGRTHLTDAQRQELERRLAEDDANAADVIPWEQVKAEALAQWGGSDSLEIPISRAIAKNF